jgi:uncharacterized membrane protein
MPLGALLGAALGWKFGGPTAGARIDAILLYALFLGFVLAPALSGAMAAARYERPHGSSRAKLIRATIVPGLGGACWGLLGSLLALLLGRYAHVEFAFPRFPMTGVTIGFAFGIITGLLTLAARSVLPRSS